MKRLIPLMLLAALPFLGQAAETFDESDPFVLDLRAETPLDIRNVQVSVPVDGTVHVAYDITAHGPVTVILEIYVPGLDPLPHPRSSGNWAK